MADLLAKWLNEEIVLSKKITDFETDFSSGYLIGELLYKFNQQENFTEFSTKDNITAKVKNFEKLEPTLRNLNIKFDSIVIDKIMKQERGFALRLLYQLKMILEKVYPPTDIAILRKTGKVGDNQPALKIGSSKDTYNKMSSSFFKTRLQAMNKPQKQQNMEGHLKQFEDEAIRQANEAARYLQEEKMEGERVKQEIRRAQINKLQRNAGFMEEWLQKGVEDWKQNMAHKKEREQSQLEFEYKQAQKFNEMTVAKIDGATNEVIEGIQQFEETLKNQGINPRVTKEFAAESLAQSFSTSSPQRSLKTQKQAQQLLSRPTMGLGGTMTKNGGLTLGSVGLRSKAKKPLDDKQKKERERRRMRMIADQLSLVQNIEKQRRESEVLERMKRQSKQEEELSYEAWRTQQCKTIISENRKLREAKYDKRTDLDIQNAIFKEKQMLDSMEDQMLREIETLNHRDAVLRENALEAKKLRQTTECRKMIDAIFDIANEAFIHQQKQDSDSIDPRNWHEWQQLFIQALPIVGHQGEAEEEKETTADSITPEHIELVDYLQNKGQWPTELVSENKPNLEQILSGADAGAPAGGKGAKGAPKGGETIALEEGDTEVPNAPQNNYFVGDAIEQIINLNFEARGKQLRPKNPHYLNLKLCFVGYAFAGKRLQAMKLKQEYGLDTFTMSDLVEEALKFYSENPNPIIKERAIDNLAIKESIHEDSKEESMKMQEEHQPNQDQPPEDEKNKSTGQFPGLGQNPLFNKTGPINTGDEDKVSEASEIEEELNPEEDFRLCGQRIQDCLFEGVQISDQLYIDLYIAKLRMNYEYKDRATLKAKTEDEARQELDLTRQIANLMEELHQMQDPNSAIKRKKKRTPEVVQKEIQACQEELASLKSVEKNGWILIDFPTNFGQAMLLEKALSGYQQIEDTEPTQREIELKKASLLVRPTEKPEPPKTLRPSGIDAVIWFDCSREECLRRALGRRIDGQNNIIYHIQDNPPSIEKSPLCEVIEPIDDESESMACLVDRWVAFDQNRHGLDTWLSKFGDEYTSTNLIAKIEASGDINSVYDQIDRVLKQIVEQKARKQAVRRSGIQAIIIREEEARMSHRKKDEDGKSNEDISQKDPKEDEKSQGNLTGRSNNNKSKTSARGAADASQLTTNSVLPERDNIEEDFKGILFALWNSVSTNYKGQMKRVFGKQKLQRKHIEEYFYQVQTQYIEFLKRLDGKQQVLDKFVKDFNDFSDQYPDLREDDHTKEELHQRCDILSDELWEISEERKDQNVEERKKIMESGWAEFTLEYMTSCAQQMMQSEIDKFKGTIQLIHDYYHAIDEKLIPEAPEHITVDIMKEEADMPEIEKIADGQDAQNIASYTYPRLEDFFKKALKAQVVPDVLAQVNDGGKKGGAPAKGKDAKGKAAEDDKPKVESIYVGEMKEAIKVEKSIFRYRLCQIRNWALKRLRHQREQSLRVYKKLDDWIQVSYKAENDAIEEVCDVIKNAIEEQRKIQVELRINFMDFYIDNQIHNFIIPPPEKLPPMEQPDAGKFNIPQLKSMVQELKMLANKAGMIANRDVINLLVRKVKNSRSLVDVGGLPKSWSNFTQVHFEKMVRNLDTKMEGSINHKTLATCFLLLSSNVPTSKDLEVIKANLKESSVSENVFLGKEGGEQKPWWFHESERTKDRENSIPFPRVASIKSLLFSVHAVNGKIDVGQFLASLMSSDKQVKTYQQILFGI